MSGIGRDVRANIATIQAAGSLGDAVLLALGSRATA